MGRRQAPGHGTVRAALLNGFPYVLARGTHVIHMARFSIAHDTWEEMPSFAFLTDAGGWANPVHNETIRAVAVVGG